MMNSVETFFSLLSYNIFLENSGFDKLITKLKKQSLYYFGQAQRNVVIVVDEIFELLTVLVLTLKQF